MEAEATSSALLWAIGYLEVEDEPRLAALLEDCDLRVWSERDEMLALVAEEWANADPLVSAVLTVPGELYEEAAKREGRLGGVMEEALGKLDYFSVEPGPKREWSNQGAAFDRTLAPHIWEAMRFRSYSELCIAKALERANVCFMPNTVVRHGASGEDRISREVDFLVVDSGRVGILEVDGAPWHPPARASEEHTRDRCFRSAGWAVERFDAQECRDQPDAVVAQFLRVLRNLPS
jgi:hypothetical protein